MDVERVAELLTAERLHSYARATATQSEALRLYAWNMRAAGAVLELSAAVEVIVRNALDRELTNWAVTRHGHPSWFDVVPLDAQGRADVAKARARATRNGRRREIHGRVVAELSFGFWRFLVESRYLTTLWMPALHQAFPHGARDLPIHARDLWRDRSDAVDLLAWIDPSGKAWADATTSLASVLDARPSA